jgi:hypothetical protein
VSLFFSVLFVEDAEGFVNESNASKTKGARLHVGAIITI